jgi:hypothetical protein
MLSWLSNLARHPKYNVKMLCYYSQLAKKSSGASKIKCKNALLVCSAGSAIELGILIYSV